MDDMILTYHLAGFFDVLGQRAHLSKLRRLPQTDAEKQEVAAILKRTAGAIVMLRSGYSSFFEAFNEPSEFVEGLPVKLGSAVREATSAELRQWGFSDSVVTAVNLSEENVHPSRGISGVYRSLVAASGMWLLGMSMGLPIRGGMEVGLGVPICSNEVYGPCVQCAYDLESQLAQAPRIVVGPSLISYLDEQSRRQQDSPTSSLIRGLADVCQSLIIRDLDGVPCLDPLAKLMAHIYRTAKPVRVAEAFNVFAAARAQVGYQLAAAETKADDKLAGRYRPLLRRFEQALPDWT